MASELAASIKGTASPRRWNTLFALVLCSFTAGTIFGASLVRFHGESVNVAISRMTLSLQEEAVASASYSADTIANRNGNQCATEDDIQRWCQQRGYYKVDMAIDNNNGTKGATTATITQAEQRALVDHDSLERTTPVYSTFAKLSRQARAERQKQAAKTAGAAGSQVAPLKQVVKSLTNNKGSDKLPYHPSRLTGSRAAWCPSAKCRATDLCRPCKRRFLILITTARSASTTLTWMLDALPGIRMSGENANTLGFLKKLMDNVLLNPNFKHSTGMRASWGHHYVPKQSLSCVSQAMIEGINPPLLRQKTYIKDVNASETDIVGFKTIRFFKDADTPEQERNTLAWLRSNFPCSRVIVNINSDVEQYTASIHKAWKKASLDNTTEDGTRESLLKQNQQLKKVVKLLGPKQAFLLDKNEWANDISKLNEAVTWMGFHHSCQFTELLEFNSKGNGYGHGKTTMPKFPSTCVRLDD